MTRLLCAGLCAVGAFSAWNWGHSSGRGCATVRPKDVAVEFADQSAVILWDSANKIEHFIRWASFATQTADFGFLVPTPTKPSLAEVSDNAFTLLENMIK